ncbi:MAG: tRNA (adenosine(37)-N6)-dimethylallyltransferase MiaA [Anaerovorax sp.]
MEKILIIVGPTAVGKTKYAIEAGKQLHGEIISADSMQLYQHLDIGSAKPTATELAQVKHYLVDAIDPAADFSAAQYQRLAKEAIAQVLAKGKLPIVSGGTGLYINSIIYQMDFSTQPKDTAYREALEREAQIFGKEYVHNLLKEKDAQAAQRIHPNNLRKVIRALEVLESTNVGIKEFKQSFVKNAEYEYRLIGLNRDREQLYGRIDARVDQLINMGLVEEVTSLLNRGLSEKNSSMKGIGYKEIIGHLKGEYDLEQAIYLVKKNSRNYAKRQLTWFRRYADIEWFQISAYSSEEVALEEFLKWL